MARRYARAFLDALAPERRARADDNLAAAAAVLTEPPVGPLFLHPGIAPEEKTAAMDRVFADEPDIAHMVGVLIAHRRERLLPQVSAEFHRERLAAEGRVLATVRTARPLDPAWRDRVVAVLARVTGREVEAGFAVAPELLGGIEVRVGDRLWDGSVRGRLSRLARQLKDEVRPGAS